LKSLDLNGSWICYFENLGTKSFAIGVDLQQRRHRIIPIKFANNSIENLIGKPLATVSFLIIALMMTGSIVVVLIVVSALWNVNLETLPGAFHCCLGISSPSGVPRPNRRKPLIGGQNCSQVD
jgi:hypothetical protein